MDDDEDEEYSNEFIPLIPRRSHSHRLAIRRTLIRSSPYHTTSTNIRRREHSSLVSRTINNLISNIEDQNIVNNHVPTNVTTSNNENPNHLREDFLLSSDEDHNHEDLELIVDLSQTSQADLPINHGEFSHCQDLCLTHLLSKIIPMDLFIQYLQSMMKIILMSISIIIHQQRWKQLFLQIIPLIFWNTQMIMNIYHQ